MDGLIVNPPLGTDEPVVKEPRDMGDMPHLAECEQAVRESMVDKVLPGSQ